MISCGDFLVSRLVAVVILTYVRIMEFRKFIREKVILFPWKTGNPAKLL